MVRCWQKDQVNRPLKWWAENVSKTKGEGLLLAKVSWIGKQYWIGFQSREVKVSLSFFSFKTMKCLEQLISVRSCCIVYTNRGNDRFWLASFSCCQKKSNNFKNLASLLSFTEIAVMLCSDADFKASLGWEDRSKHVGTQTLSMDHKTTPSTTTKCLK